MLELTMKEISVKAYKIVGLKESIPYIVQAIRQDIVTFNHASNVHVFSSLASIFNSNSHQYIKHPANFDKEA